MKGAVLLLQLIYDDMDVHTAWSLLERKEAVLEALQTGKERAAGSLQTPWLHSACRSRRLPRQQELQVTDSTLCPALSLWILAAGRRRDDSASFQRRRWGQKHHLAHSPFRSFVRREESVWQDVRSRAECALICSRVAAQSRKKLIIFHFLLPAAMRGGRRGGKEQYPFYCSQMWSLETVRCLDSFFIRMVMKQLNNPDNPNLCRRWKERKSALSVSSSFVRCLNIVQN